MKNLNIGSMIQIVKGKYKWCIGSIISINDNIALIEIDNELTVSCEVEDLEVLAS